MAERSIILGHQNRPYKLLKTSVPQETATCPRVQLHLGHWLMTVDQCLTSLTARHLYLIPNKGNPSMHRF